MPDENDAGRPALVLERKDQPNKTAQVGPMMFTPPIDEDYWLYRVRLTEKQAIVAFPKFGTIGIGFAQEEDWNTNLPYTCETREIFNHIDHNKGDDAISDEDCVTAIGMVQAAITQSTAEPEAQEPRTFALPTIPADVKALRDKGGRLWAAQMDASSGSRLGWQFRTLKFDDAGLLASIYGPTFTEAEPTENDYQPS